MCAASGTCPQYVTAGILKGKLGFANRENPDDSPVFGCAATTYTDCVKESVAYSLPAAYDGNYLVTTWGTQSKPIPVSSAWRFPYVNYQVQLDSEYADVTAVDIWSTTTSSWNTRYTNALDIYLSPAADYLCAGCGIRCATNWTATLNAPAKNTVNCSQTLNNTRFVTVHKPLFTPTASSDSIYIYEIKVVRAGK